MYWNQKLHNAHLPADRYTGGRHPHAGEASLAHVGSLSRQNGVPGGMALRALPVEGLQHHLIQLTSQRMLVQLDRTELGASGGRAESDVETTGVRLLRTK